MAKVPHCLAVMALLAVQGLLGLAAGHRHLRQAPTVQRRVLMYLWTGSPQMWVKDYIITLDVTHQDDPSFGTILSTVDTPFADLEPHHAGTTADNRVLAVGSFNSFLGKSRYGLKADPPSILFYDVHTDPINPKFMKGISGTYGAVVDDFIRKSDGGFLVALMGNSTGGTPGRIGDISPYNWTTGTGLEMVGEYLPPEGERHNFNPHGLLLMGPPVNRFVSCDLMDYASAIRPGDLSTAKFRSTLRIWSSDAKTFYKTIDVGPENAHGLMKVMAVGPPGSSKVLFETGNGWIWGLDVLTYELKKIMFFDRPAGSVGNFVFSPSFRGGTRVVMTDQPGNRVFLFNVADPFNPIVLQVHQLPEGAGPHAVSVHPDGNIFMCTDYFIEMDSRVGTIKYKQDKKLRLFVVAADGNSFTPHPRVPHIDLHKIYKQSRGGANAHGWAFKVVNITMG